VGKLPKMGKPEILIFFYDATYFLEKMIFIQKNNIFATYFIRKSIFYVPKISIAGYKWHIQ